MPLAGMFARQILVFGLVVLLAACSSAPERGTEPVAAPRQTAQQAASTDPIKAALYAQYREWRGAPYRYGGLSKHGIDCSGFVQLTLQRRFGSNVPRTTIEQVRTGHAVSRGHWQAGDLVFFRTGHKKRHVGIYVEDGKFLHASNSDGVTLSSLHKPYWQQRYWTTRRIR